MTLLVGRPPCLEQGFSGNIDPASSVLGTLGFGQLWFPWSCDMIHDPNLQ